MECHNSLPPDAMDGETAFNDSPTEPTRQHLSTQAASPTTRINGGPFHASTPSPQGGIQQHGYDPDCQYYYGVSIGLPKFRLINSLAPSLNRSPCKLSALYH